MRTIQMTLDDELVKKVDAISKELNTSRSAFTRHALQEAVKQHNIDRLEIKGEFKLQVHHEQLCKRTHEASDNASISLVYGLTFLQLMQGLYLLHI